ncbi:MAG: hypothetical protein Q4B63_10695 [Clostridium perfringens]|nr:hypothetical protein [Clostridium perfringens]
MELKEYKLKFSNTKEIKRSLSKVANLVINKKLKHYDASAIATICNTILKAEKQLETEKEIEELRELIEELKNKEN